jgi:hypothetical protein
MTTPLARTATTTTRATTATTTSGFVAPRHCSLPPPPLVGAEAAGRPLIQGWRPRAWVMSRPRVLCRAARRKPLGGASGLARTKTTAPGGGPEFRLAAWLFGETSYALHRTRLPEDDHRRLFEERRQRRLGSLRRNYRFLFGDRMVPIHAAGFTWSSSEKFALIRVHSWLYSPHVALDPGQS